MYGLKRRYLGRLFGIFTCVLVLLLVFLAFVRLPTYSSMQVVEDTQEQVQLTGVTQEHFSEGDIVEIEGELESFPGTVVSVNSEPGHLSAIDLIVDVEPTHLSLLRGNSILVSGTTLSIGSILTGVAF